MSTRSQLLALNDELRRLKAGGTRSISVSEESLAALRQATAAVRPRPMEGRAPASPSPVAPVAAVMAPTPASRELGPPPARPAAASPSQIEDRKSQIAPPAAPALPPPPVVVLPAGDKQARWDALRALVLADPVCRAHVRPGCRVVFGVGHLEAKIFFVGEAPGEEEELQGEPFVGPAGQLLNRMIKGMGLEREQVYIGNIMNWRPQMATAPGVVQHGNRAPNAEEIAYCLPFIRAQIEIIQPAMLVALGATAAHGLLGRAAFRTMGEVRGRWLECEGRPVIVTYHPSYILRKEADSAVSAKKAKRAVWEDLLKVMERAQLPISDKQRGFFL